MGPLDFRNMNKTKYRHPGAFSFMYLLQFLNKILPQIENFKNKTNFPFEQFKQK